MFALQQLVRFAAREFIPDANQSFAQFQTNFHGIGKAFSGIGVDGKTVNDNIDVMLYIPTHFNVIFDVIKSAVHTDAGVALLFDVREHLR